MNARLKRLLPKALLAVLGGLLLAAAFLAYLRPGFVLDLANRFILC